MQSPNARPRVAIACGGTGGHLFPGLAVAEQLAARDCAVTLLISPKEVDQRAVRNIRDFDVVILPATGLTPGRPIQFLRGFVSSYRAALCNFRTHPPVAVLAMGGFTAAPPVLAGRSVGAMGFLHEANSIPGRANRFLAQFVEEAFVYFEETARHLSHQRIRAYGMPVRSQFQPHDAAACRMLLGLNPNVSTFLVMGGSQGAAGINDLVLKTLPLLREQAGEFQLVHLTGSAEFDKVSEAVANAGIRGVVRPFLTEMEHALGAATLCVCRAGASSIAELAAMRVPSILMPYPHAANDHQHHNARALERAGAARLLSQQSATPEKLAEMIAGLRADSAKLDSMKQALAPWDTPQAAGRIAGRILELVGVSNHSSSAVTSTGRETHVSREERTDLKAALSLTT
jgi:UDP-N-acetylglucosamine--N-acetylmuramyl-(pentapeptide) pyrophosphoryl-undecaprenol N-acetylglucosamine transferase